MGNSTNAARTQEQLFKAGTMAPGVMMTKCLGRKMCQSGQKGENL